MKEIGNKHYEKIIKGSDFIVLPKMNTPGSYQKSSIGRVECAVKILANKYTKKN